VLTWRVLQGTVYSRLEFVVAVAVAVEVTMAVTVPEYQPYAIRFGQDSVNLTVGLPDDSGEVMGVVHLLLIIVFASAPCCWWLG
jgi:hypothetical protein